MGNMVYSRFNTKVVYMLILMISLGCNRFLKIDPVADVDKNPLPPAANDNSCWMATAANMLSGAGYGDGNTHQQRAGDIYGDMVNNYGTANRGWPQTALQWWLGSNNNTWPNNPYTLVSWHGNTSMYPWNDSDIPMFIANELRKCHFLGLAFSWPTDAVDPWGQPIIGTGGHATTPWGDSFTPEEVPINPFDLRMADSDRDNGGDHQRYFYDSYSNPNPGGPNEGAGYYFNYSNPHPYIRGIVTLEPVDDITDNRQTQIVVGSYRIHQGNLASATDLHYTVGTDVRILSYGTRIDWDHTLSPEIEEDQSKRKISVEWDLTSKPVKRCNYVTITTEFVLPGWNAIYYRDVHFTYPRVSGIDFADIAWQIETPLISQSDTIQDIVGGYVLGGFEIINPTSEETREIIAEYRFIHQYLFNQSPEQHRFKLAEAEGLTIRNLKIGHSYERLSSKDLWNFNDWMTVNEQEVDLSNSSYELNLDWSGKLPYPEGIDVREIRNYIDQKQPIFRKPKLIRYRLIK